MLAGSFEARWTADEFGAALTAAGEPKMAGRSTGDGYPGVYTVTFDDGRFDIVHDRSGIYCTGSYTVTDDRVRLHAERRDAPFGCLPGRYLDATFVSTDGGLTLSAADAHPVDVVLFATRPLARVER